MSKSNTFKKRFPMVAKAAVLAVFAAPLVIGQVSGVDFGLITAAHAEGQGNGGMGKQYGRDGQTKGGHESTSPSSGVDSTLSGDDGEEGGGSGGQRGPDETSDAKGPRANQPESGKKGNPQWAGDGAIPEVELGRLNVARSPSHVLERSLTEATTALTNNDSLYVLTYDEALAAIRSGLLPDGTEIFRVDSPLENLALYKELLNTGEIKLSDGSTLTTNMTDVQLAAILLGGASDKTVPISDDTVIAINTILQVSDQHITEADVHDLAVAADAVRAAILQAHDE